MYAVTAQNMGLQVSNKNDAGYLGFLEQKVSFEQNDDVRRHNKEMKREPRNPDYGDCVSV